MESCYFEFGLKEIDYFIESYFAVFVAIKLAELLMEAVLELFILTLLFYDVFCMLDPTNLLLVHLVVRVVRGLARHSLSRSCSYKILGLPYLYMENLVWICFLDSI